MGLTQAALSQVSGISIPMVQLVESGEGNPSVKTLSKIFKPLGLNWEIKLESANWDLLTICGLPIYAEKNYNISPSAKMLVSQIKIAIEELKQNFNKKSADFLRKNEALESLVIAIKHYYPTFYKKELSVSKSVNDFVPKELTGRHIKLVRLCGPYLARYL